IVVASSRSPPPAVPARRMERQHLHRLAPLGHPEVPEPLQQLTHHIAPPRPAAAHRAGPVGQTGCWPSRNASLRVLGRSRRALRDGPLICGTDTTCLVPTGSRAAGYLHHSVGLTPCDVPARRGGERGVTPAPRCSTWTPQPAGGLS